MKPGDLVRYMKPDPGYLRDLGLVVRKLNDELQGSNPLVEVHWINGAWSGKRMYMTRSKLRKVNPAPPGQHLAKKDK